MNSPKYNRTYHFQWSQGATDDDKIAKDCSGLIGKEIIITEKIDGSNTSLEHDGCFARTHAGPPTHRSFDLLKSLHSTVKHKIPQNIQLFGEFAFAQHSICYSELPGYFLLFAVRELGITEEFQPIWASWEEVEMWAQEIGVPTVPVLFKGIVSSEEELKELTNSFMNEPSCCGGIREGVVARISSGFVDNSFSKFVLKNVRKNHVQTSVHWKDQAIIRNKLKE